MKIHPVGAKWFHADKQTRRKKGNCRFFFSNFATSVWTHESQASLCVIFHIFTFLPLRDSDVTSNYFTIASFYLFPSLLFINHSIVWLLYANMPCGFTSVTKMYIAHQVKAFTFQRHILRVKSFGYTKSCKDYKKWICTNTDIMNGQSFRGVIA